jgi:acetyl-CoA C-acetyltransferase
VSPQHDPKSFCRYASDCVPLERLTKRPSKEIINPKGSAIALCHPIGPTGCILPVNALYELRRIGKRYALIMMCIGGGQGISMIIERL